MDLSMQHAILAESHLMQLAQALAGPLDRLNTDDGEDPGGDAITAVRTAVLAAEQAIASYPCAVVHYAGGRGAMFLTYQIGSQVRFSGEVQIRSDGPPHVFWDTPAKIVAYDADPDAPYEICIDREDVARAGREPFPGEYLTIQVAPHQIGEQAATLGAVAGHAVISHLAEHIASRGAVDDAEQLVSDVLDLDIMTNAVRDAFDTGNMDPEFLARHVRDAVLESIGAPIDQDAIER